MTDDTRPKAKSLRTLDLTPGHGEMIKPSELIDLSGASRLSLADRRTYNLLIQAAFGPDLGVEGRRFQIPVSELKTGHESNDRLVESLEALMKTIVTIKRSDGSTDRVQLLGWNNLADPTRPKGVLTYAIAPELAMLLRDSSVFAKLEIEVLRAFTSKYALALYEAIARRVRLQHVAHEKFDVAEFREMIGVPPGKLTTFGNLNAVAIKPALAEINGLAEFDVTALPIKEGRRVVAVDVGWGMKSIERQKEAFAELHRHSAGRRARLEGLVEDLEE